MSSVCLSALIRINILGSQIGIRYWNVDCSSYDYFNVKFKIIPSHSITIMESLLKLKYKVGLFQKSANESILTNYWVSLKK